MDRHDRDDHDEQEPVDPLPGMIAGIDQMLAFVPQWARVTKARYDALLEEGFTEQQALYVTAVQWLKPEAPN